MRLSGKIAVDATTTLFTASNIQKGRKILLFTMMSKSTRGVVGAVYLYGLGAVRL